MTTTPAPKGADIELAPCPFCGGAAQATTGFTTSGDWPHRHFDRIFCTSCQCRQLFHRTKAEAVAAWNRRSGSSTSTSQGAAPGDALDAINAQVRTARDAVRRVWADMSVLHEDKPVELAAIITTVALLVSSDLELAVNYMDAAIATSTAQGGTDG